MTFISVLRLVALWFPGRTVPLITQLTGILGQFGSLAAAYPLVALLHGTSWRTTFLGAAATGAAGRRARARRPAGRPGRHRARPGVRPGRAAPQAGRHVARAGHADGALHAPGHAVLRHRLRAALGLSVPGGRPGAVTGDGGGPAHPARGRRHVRRPAPGPALRTVAAAPVGAGLHDPRRHGRRLDRRPPVAGPRAAAAAGAAGRRPRHQRPGLDDRLRLRAHLEPGGAAGQRQRGGQRGRLRRLAAHDPRRRRRARPADPGLLDRRTASTPSARPSPSSTCSGRSGWSACSRHRRELRARLARDGVVLAPLYVAVAARIRGGSAYR